jgi:putative salt-induced outer membrane protein
MRTGPTLLTVMILVPAMASAGDPPAAKPPANGWSGKGQIGILASQGNAQAKSANAALDLAYVAGSWKHALHADLLYGESADVVSAERWDALWQSNRQFSSKFFAFGAVRYEHDLFDGFEYQGSGAVGIGYLVLDSQSVKLSVQLGAGYMLSRPEVLTKDVSGAVIARALQPVQNYAIATAGVDYEHKLTDTTTLSDKFLVNAGGENTLFTNALALAVKVSTKLALSLGYNIQDNTHAPPGIKSLDTTETINLVYAF